MNVGRELSLEVGAVAACWSMGMARATCYRRLQPELQQVSRVRATPESTPRCSLSGTKVRELHWI